MDFYRFHVEVYMDRQRIIEKGIVLGNSMSDAIKNLEAMYASSTGDTEITDILKFYKTDIDAKVVYDSDMTEMMEWEKIKHDMDKHSNE